MSPRAWRPAVRLARRDLARHKVRASLTFLLVALPVMVAALLAVGVHNGRSTPETWATEQMGAADALVRVSPFAAVRPQDAVYGATVPARGKDRARRDPADVDLASLLPAGSRVEPGPANGQLDLASGGSAMAQAVPDDGLAAPIVRVVTGRQPRSAAEVLVGHGVAKVLELLDASGAPKRDASLALADGSRLRVVGTIPTDGPYLRVSGRPGLPLTGDSVDTEGPAYLVSLPSLSTSRTKALVRDLAAQGVVVQPRDATLHPERWGQGDSGSGTDTESVAVGALVVLVGLVEVVLVVGAAFAVAGRRQLRDLGLVAANGGVGKDVRRLMLAQGLVLGVTGSVVGAAAGTALGLLGGRWAERRFDVVLYTSDVPWPAVVAVTVLGALTAVVAALVPAWSLGRVTPVQALSGRFPVRLRAVRPHQGSFVLAGLGLVALVAGGFLTSRWFAPRGSENPIGPFVSGLGLVLLVAGVVWATPYLVQVGAAAGRSLPLSGRYAFRAAGRHHFRTAAATTALTFTVAVAVLAGFVVSEAARGAATDSDVHALFVDSSGERSDDARIRATIEDTLGPVELASSRTVGRQDRWLVVRGNGGYPEVREVDETSLRAVAGALTDAQLAAFRDGALVVTDQAGFPAGRDRARLGLEGPRSAPLGTVPVVRVEGRSSGEWGNLGSAFISTATADRLRVEPSYASYVALADRTITDADVQAVNATGISAWSNDPERQKIERFQLVGVLGAALLSLLVVGIAVALSAAEGRDEAATLSAVGAGPGRRRGIGAMHGLFLGLAGIALGVAVGLPGALAFVQLNGEPGVDVPWGSFLGTLAAVALLSPVAGWVVTPTRLPLTRRAT